MDSTPYFKILDKFISTLSNFNKTEIIRQCFSLLEEGEASVKTGLVNNVKFNLLDGSFSEEEKSLIRAAASEIIIRLYYDCDQNNLFLKKEDKNCFFPYFIETISSCGFVMRADQPFAE